MRVILLECKAKMENFENIRTRIEFSILMNKQSRLDQYNKPKYDYNAL